MEPFDSPVACLTGAPFHKLSADALSLTIQRHGRVQKKTMATTVTHDLGESDQPLSLIGADVKQGMLKHRQQINIDVLRPCAGKQCIECII